MVNGYLLFRAHEADIRYRNSDNTYFRDQRSRFSWYFGLAYFVNMADAFAGAYLYKFNKIMELTVNPEIYDDTIGMAFTYRF
jgi:hypothetical protein